MGKLIAQFPSEKQVLNLTTKELESVEGLAKKSAEIIHQELQQKKPLLEKLKKLGVEIS